MKTKSQSKVLHRKLPQRGAALIILMLAIVLSLVTLVTFRSERKGPELEAQRKTTLALAQAKEALLGRAASNSDSGTLSCPSIDGALGISNTKFAAGGGIECGNGPISSNFGWLPWKSLNLGDLRDGSASLLWYMLGSGYVDKGNYSPPPTPFSPLTVMIILVDVNPGDLRETIVNVTAIPNIAAAIIAPGAPFPGQVRSGAALTNSSNFAAYFEGVAVSATNTLTIKIEQKRNYPLLKYNDQYLLITNKEILERSTPGVAQAIAAELNTNYASGYPPTGWLPSGGVWGGGGTYVQWITLNAGTYPTRYQNVGISGGSVQFSSCAATFNITQTATGAQVTRSGRC